MIKRRFLATRWDLNNGVLLCHGHHEEAERATVAMQKMLEYKFTFHTESVRRQIEDMLLFIDAKHGNPPSVRFTFLEMQDIVCELEKKFEIMS